MFAALVDNLSVHDVQGQDQRRWEGVRTGCMATGSKVRQGKVSQPEGAGASEANTEVGDIRRH